MKNKLLADFKTQLLNELRKINISLRPQYSCKALDKLSRKFLRSLANVN